MRGGIDITGRLSEDYIMLYEKKQVISNTMLYLFLTVVLIGTLFPLLYTILASFKSNAEILTNPEYVA